MNESEIKQFIVNNLQRPKEFTLATTDDQGNPWVVALNLCYDGQFDIIWQSAKDAEHSKHIAERPDVALCVFGDYEDIGDFGFYAQATAYAVTDPQELEEKLRLRFVLKGLPVPVVENYLGDSPNRLYCAKLNRAWINSQHKVKQPVDLTHLRMINDY